MFIVVELPGQEDADEAKDAIQASAYRAGFDAIVRGAILAPFEPLVPYLTGERP